MLDMRDTSFQRKGLKWSTEESNLQILNNILLHFPNDQNIKTKRREEGEEKRDANCWSYSYVIAYPELTSL